MKRSVDIIKEHHSYLYMVTRNKIRYFYSINMTISETLSGKIRISTNKKCISSTEYYSSRRKFGKLSRALYNMNWEINSFKKLRALNKDRKE